MCKTNNMGFIKIHRNIREWGWYDDPNTLVVWVHLLIDANYDEKEWRGEHIEVGSMITSIAKLSDEIGLTPKQIRICLNRLSKEGKIVVKGTNKWTKITICNYDSYMESGEDAGQAEGKQRTNKGQAEGKQRATTKEYKEIKNVEEEKKVYNTKEKSYDKDAVERIYKLYPTTCPVNKRATGKSYKDKERIERLLTKFSEKELSDTIIRYVQDCIENNTYIKNFATFLNNIPDYSQTDTSLFKPEDGSEDWIDGRRPQKV